MLEILGIHSNVTANATLSAGHAWLSMHFTNGRQTTVGLWTTTLFEVKRLVKDPTGLLIDESFDVNFGLEASKGYEAAASRYYKLSETQSRRAVALMGSYTGWRYTNTCATWATKVVKELLGEDLDASEFGGATDTPRALGATIQKMEQIGQTSLRFPKTIKGNPITKGSLAQ